MKGAINARGVAWLFDLLSLEREGTDFDASAGLAGMGGYSALLRLLGSHL